MNTQDLINEMDKESMEARNYIMKDMTEKGYGAILWGENLFGSTNYPLIDFNGKETPIKGFRLSAPDKLLAVVGLHDNIEVTGVKTYTMAEADRDLGTVAHDQDYYTDGGSPEQWEIAADCYKVAIQTLNAEKDYKKDTWF